MKSVRSLNFCSNPTFKCRLWIWYSLIGPDYDNFSHWCAFAMRIPKLERSVYPFVRTIGLPSQSRYEVKCGLMPFLEIATLPHDYSNETISPSGSTTNRRVNISSQWQRTSPYMPTTAYLFVIQL